jgi:hypothetical protein
MTWWSYGERLRALRAPAPPVPAGSAPGNTGQVVQRPDQGSQPPGTAVSPSQAAGIQRARVIIISGTNSGWFIYNGTPGPGNPPIAYGVGPGTTTDLYGNSLPVSDSVASVGTGHAFAALNDGQAVFNGSAAVAFSPSFIAASSAAAGILGLNSGLASNVDTATSVLVNSAVNGGGLQVVSFDGNTYDTERLSMLASATPQTVNSTSTAVITGLSCQVAAGTYTLRGKVRWTQGGSGGQQALRLEGTGGATASAVDVEVAQYELSTTGETVVASTLTALNQDTGNFGAGGPGAGAVMIFDLDGSVVFSAGGGFNLSARCVTSGADTYVIDYAKLELFPV